MSHKNKTWKFKNTKREFIGNQQPSILPLVEQISWIHANYGLTNVSKEDEGSETRGILNSKEHGDNTRQEYNSWYAGYPTITEGKDIVQLTEVCK